MHAQLLNHVQLFATPSTVALQAPLSMGFTRQECWSGLPCPSPGDLPDSGIEPESPASSTLAGGFYIGRWILPLTPPDKDMRLKKKKKSDTCGPIAVTVIHQCT